MAGGDGVKLVARHGSEVESAARAVEGDAIHMHLHAERTIVDDRSADIEEQRRTEEGGMTADHAIACVFIHRVYDEPRGHRDDASVCDVYVVARGIDLQNNHHSIRIDL